MRLFYGLFAALWFAAVGVTFVPLFLMAVDSAHAAAPKAAHKAAPKVATNECMTIDELKASFLKDGVDKAIVNSIKQLSPEDYAAFMAKAQHAPEGTASVYAVLIFDEGVAVFAVDAKGCVLKMGEVSLEAWASIFDKPKADSSKGSPLPHGGDFAGHGPEELRI